MYKQNQCLQCNGTMVRYLVKCTCIWYLNDNKVHSTFSMLTLSRYKWYKCTNDVCMFDVVAFYCLRGKNMGWNVKHTRIFCFTWCRLCAGGVATEAQHRIYHKQTRNIVNKTLTSQFLIQKRLGNLCCN